VKIYNTKTREKQDFKSIVPGEIGIYVCGVTVYDDCHMGHARTFAAFDVIVRYLKYQGYAVNFVRNITDIDDKIIARANELAIDYQSLVTKYILSMHEDVAKLGFLLPTTEPRATQFMPQMITMVQQLIAAGYAYVAKSGDVYYSVPAFKNYGQLCGHIETDEAAVSRLQVSEDKQHSADFVLWKMSKAGEPSWDSPFGSGRPGWHLECSAMANSLLGDTFDLHGGGYDLITPHHENECAQSEALTSQPLANYWLHVGFLQINAQKMAKSLGNFKTIKQMLLAVDVESLKMFLLSAHYRSFLDYSDDNIHKAQSSIETMYLAIRYLDLSVAYIKDTAYEQKFMAQMDDDFNTPGAISVLFDVVKDLNKEPDMTKKNVLGVILVHLAQILGLLNTSVDSYFNQPIKISVAEVEYLITQRNQARIDKNWSQADLIRQQLKDVNIIIEDSNGVTTWRVTHVTF
jgi:cysteinyl-tRNA synthetase